MTFLSSTNRGGRVHWPQLATKMARDDSAHRVDLFVCTPDSFRKAQVGVGAGFLMDRPSIVSSV